MMPSPAFVRRARAASVDCIRQRGVVLLLVVLTLTTILGAAMLYAALQASSRGITGDGAIARQKGVADLRQALFGYVLSAPISGSYIRPGSLPGPDSLVNSKYDGQNDGTCLSNTSNGLPKAGNTSTTQRCLGRWPWKIIPIDLSDAARNADGSLAAHDPTGAIPWLAVSANLALPNGCNFELNSDVLNKTYTAFNCATSPYGTELPYPWLTVRGADGSILTNRAAAVIILPGEILKREDGYQQARTTGAPGNPRDYLDRIALPLGCQSSCTGTYDNGGMTNEFVSLPPGQRYPENAEDSSKSGAVPFNDIVTYITIDELMPYIERRVLIEMKASLNSFASTPEFFSGTIGYPWAANYASPTSDSVFLSNPGTLVGMMPFFPVSPVGTPSGYATSYSYNIQSVQYSPSNYRNCVQVQTSPAARWTNIAENTINETLARLGLSFGIGVWRGTSTLKLSAGGSPNATTFSKTFALYDSSSNCASGSSSVGSATYSVTRTVSILADNPQCASTPTVRYIKATATQPHRLNWSCNRLSAPTNSAEFQISITDALASPVPVTATYPIFPAANATVSINSLLYQPLMADWYFDNGWYKQAFYAVANQAAPATTANCSSTSTLTVGSQTGVNAVAILAGKSLTNAARPTLPVSDYLEGANATASSTCVFAAATRTIDSTYNDHVVVVAP